MEWKKNPQGLGNFFVPLWWTPSRGRRLPVEVFDLKLADRYPNAGFYSIGNDADAMASDAGRSIYNLVRVFD